MFTSITAWMALKTKPFHTDRDWVGFGMASRYGAGELYGFDFSTLSAERIRELAQATHRDIVCPFKPVQPGKPAPKCKKKGGVCSLRQFVKDEEVEVNEVPGNDARKDFRWLRN